MNIPLSRDLLSALFFIGLGAIAIWFGAGYPMGTPSSMGAGYFPMMTSGGLILIGSILIVRSFLVESEPVGLVPVRPLAIIIASIAMFALVVETVGFIAAGIALVIGVGMAGERPRLLEIVVLALALTASCYLLFVWGLGLSLPRSQLW